MLTTTYPDQDPDVLPDLAAIEDASQQAWDRLQRVRADREASSVAEVVGWVWSVIRVHVLGIHRALVSLNQMLLPPLFTLMLVDLYRFGLSDTDAPDNVLMNLGFCVSFGSEWLLGLCVAAQPRAYLRNVWLWMDLLSSIPFGYAFQALRITRLGRLVRLLRLLRLARARRFNFPRNRILRAVGTALSVCMCGAIAIQAIEPATFAAKSDAWWWTLATVTTVGYGDVVPTTVNGRLVAAVLMVTGLGVFTYVTATLSTVLFDPEEDETLRAVLRIERRLEALERRLNEPPE